MHHRHLNHQRLTLAALDDLIENGTLADWRPVLARVRRDPEGPVASRLAQLLSAKDYKESGALWQRFLDEARIRGGTARKIRSSPTERAGPLCSAPTRKVDRRPRCPSCNQPAALTADWRPTVPSSALHPQSVARAAARCRFEAPRAACGLDLVRDTASWLIAGQR
jgi:hypothetical protein